MLPPTMMSQQMLATMGSTLASFMFIWAIIRQYCPYELRRFLERYSHRVTGYFYPYIKISIHEFTGDRLKRSEAYSAVEAYLSSNTSKSAKRLKAEMVKDSSNLVLSMDEYERVTDDFRGVKVWPEKKKEIIEDLVTFSKSKDFYARIGKAWKRGYLLYGPPGTGKSTMIAAMANLLGYDIYDLELTAVKDNTELRKLLIETTSKSIIVIEDIDCSLDLTGQRKKRGAAEKGFSEDEVKGGGAGKERVKEAKEEGYGGSKVTLSGLLNFIDGLWSACGGERVVVFTTNYVEKLDPALIRRGRMDKHIELSYCTFDGFRVLAKNYLRIERHEMFEEIEKLMGVTKMTPADVAENLMPKSPNDDPEKCLLNFIQALEEAMEEGAKKKDEEIKEVDTSKVEVAAEEAEEGGGNKEVESKSVLVADEIRATWASG
ncbi:hypothetical protein C1H46_025499 [Malus baccata]|uniref:AAA+ ATPase domain-containing protein n=1 Tax=Malus baccata TaxID=106549 RepID=A0A540LR07_MALBA|nr:hypothetical protein C1H46_025499 [Malus baccata]